MFKENYDISTRYINVENIGGVKRALIEGNVFDRIKQKIEIPQKEVVRYFIKGIRAADMLIGYLTRRILFKDATVNDKRIVFFTFQGQYTCNSKYIAEKLIELHPEYEIIFIMDKREIGREKLDIPVQVKFVTRGTVEAYQALATAHFWFDNALCCVWEKMPKRRGQIYINTWHGSLGIKRLDGNWFWKNRAKVSNREVDYMITNSTFEEGVFKESFWPNVPHLKVGHPRNDIFFDIVKMKKIKEKVYKYFKIRDDVKTILYAPTFREDKKNVHAIILDYKKLKATLEARFGGEWVILMRPHFHNLNVFEFIQGQEYLLDASSYDDIQELLATADVAITDYSSWIFDYIFTGRPGFIYARDIKEYIDSRGFYYSLSDTPFSIACDDVSLSKNIMDFDEEQYTKRIKEFLEEKGCYESGKASDAVVEFVINQNEK